MKVKITLDCPERAITRSYEVELPLGYSRELFAALVDVVDAHEIKIAPKMSDKEIGQFMEDNKDLMDDLGSKD